MIFSYGITYGIAKCAGWNVSWKSLLFITVLAFVIQLILKKAKDRRIPVNLFFLFLVLMITCLYLLHLPPYTYRNQLVLYYGKWNWMTPLRMLYGWILLLLLIFTIHYLYEKQKNRFWIRCVFTAVIVVVLIGQAVGNVYWDVLPIAALLLEVLCCLTEGYQKFICKRDDVKAKQMFPFLLGVMLFIIVFPNHEEPISWQSVIHFFGQVKMGVNEIVCDIADHYDGGEFGVGMTGFATDRDSFWGKLADDYSRDMLSVSVDSRYGTEERYFTGVIKEDFKENNWSSIGTDKVHELNGDKTTYEHNSRYKYGIEGITDDTTMSEYQWDLLEHMYFLYYANIPVDEREYFCRANSYKIEYENLKTDTIFYPSNCSGLFLDSPKKKINLSDSNMFFDKKAKKGDGYMTLGLNMNLDEENVVSYLQRASSGESAFKVAGSDTSYTNEETVFDECAEALNLSEKEIDLIKDKEWEDKISDREVKIQEKDLEIPNELPQRVYDLADSLTVGLENDYDKTQAILAYLKDSGEYSYTTSPQQLQEDQNVVDAFLFENKEGYCSYFATAACILCRCAGIPSRYVEGVVVTYENGEKGWYDVHGKDAHAWTQVYIHGFGWMDVEPTPGYQIGVNGWEKKDIEGPSTDYGTEKPEAEEIDTEATLQKIKEKQKQRTEYLSYAGAGAGILGVCFLLVLIIWTFTKKIAYKKAGPDEQTKICIRKLFRILKKAGMGRNENETLRVYANRLKEEQADVECIAVIEWFEKIRYSESHADQEDVTWLEGVCKKVKRINRKKWHLFIRKR